MRRYPFPPGRSEESLRRPNVAVNTPLANRAFHARPYSSAMRRTRSRARASDSHEDGSERLTLTERTSHAEDRQSRWHAVWSSSTHWNRSVCWSSVGDSRSKNWSIASSLDLDPLGKKRPFAL